MKAYCRIVLPLLLILFSSPHVYADTERNWVLLDQTVRFDVPDDFYTIKDVNNAVWAGANKENPKFVAVIKKVDVDDFEEGLVFANLDSMLFNLSNYTQVDHKSEPFFEMSRNYFIKKYVSKEDSTRHIATYTFYSFRFPYTMLIDYGSEENYASIQGLIDGVSKVEVGGWRQLVIFWKFAKGVMLMILFIPIILPALLRTFLSMDMAALVTLLITWGLILYSMWGYPVAIILTMVFTCLEIVCFGRKKLSEIFA